MRSFLPQLIAALLASLGLAACTPPTTPFRYTGLVPAAHPLAWDGRTAKPGTLRLEGTFDESLIHRNDDPELHDTALHVPTTTLEGAATVAVSRGVEIGVRGTYASYDWSTITANGTMPLPSHPSVYGFGPELRFTVPLDRRGRWALGFGGNLLYNQVPYAEWQLAQGGCSPSPTCAADPFSGAQYSLYDERSESHFTMNLAFYPSVNLGPSGEYGHIFGGLSAHTSFKNDGFTDTASNGSTIEESSLVFFGGAGYGVKVDIVRLTAMATVPFTSSGSSVDYGFATFLSAGVDIDLTDSNKDDGRDPRDTRNTRDGDD